MGPRDHDILIAAGLESRNRGYVFYRNVSSNPVDFWDVFVTSSPKHTHTHTLYIFIISRM
jgi:hypothetical protein